MKPQRIQLRRHAGFNLQAASFAMNGLAAIKVDRTTRWGNPFVVGEEGVPDARAAVRLFRKLLDRPDLGEHHQFFVFTRERLRADLGGRNLACWCPVGQPCHAEVLLELSNENTHAPTS